MSELTWGPLGLVMHAERQRGNPVRAYLYDWQGLHGDTPQGYMRYPMDRRALELEFDFKDRLIWVDKPGTASHLLDRVTGYYLYDGEQDRGWWARHRLATWWREWERNPRPLRRVSDESD